jgi:thymidylate synthase/dihydrofolate reductase
MPLGLVFASTIEGVFARNGKLPWKCDPDMKFFKNLTSGTNVVMGRKTADSLPQALPNRNNIVLSRSGYSREGFQTMGVSEIQRLWKTEDTLIIGGAEILKFFLKEFSQDISFVAKSKIDSSFYPFAEIYSDDINLDLDLLRDLRLPIREEFQLAEGVSLEISRKTSAMNLLDKKYLDLGAKIINNPIRHGRNGATRSSFDPSFVITADFKDGFPVLQSKNVWMEGVVKEFDFFWEGKTNTLELEAQNVNIWKGNTSKEFLEKAGKLWLSPGEMGPMYGYQWRSFNKPWEPVGAALGTALDKDLDQIERLIEGIINDPFSRRHLLTTYNPAQAEEGVLYPCHSIVTQFYIEPVVEDTLVISMKTYQRSADWFLGVPFNLSSNGYLLLKIINELSIRNPSVKYIPGKVTTLFGDAHLYESHVPTFLAQYCYSHFTNKFSRTNPEFDFSKKELVNYSPVKKYTAPMIA